MLNKIIKSKIPFLLLGIGLVYLVIIIMSSHFQFINKYHKELSSGLYTTLVLTLKSLLLGGLLAFPIGIASVYGSYLTKKIIVAYVFFIRGTPMLVQIFLLYYGIGSLNFLHDTFIGDILSDAKFCALLALAINSSAYVSETIRGIILTIPKGEIEAAIAYGMNFKQRLKRIIIPRVFSDMLPSWGNESVIMLKATSLASTITVLDLMGMAKRVISKTYMTVDVYTYIGLIYLFMAFSLAIIFQMLEIIFLKHIKR